MSAYTVYTIRCADELREILIALLGEAGMEAFEEQPSGLAAYGTTDQHDRWVEAVRELQDAYVLSYTFERLPDKNWNEEWERQFHPIQIDDRLGIRASFHPVMVGVQRELVIDPKMAFGTGHHATTAMMCSCLLDHFAEGRSSVNRVLDYGSGTGVLAILAKQLGAEVVDAVDIERPAYESTLENAALNGVALDRVVHGELSDLPIGKPYDLLLANINRNVLLDSAAPLYQQLKSGGYAYLSGLLAQDADRVIEHWRAAGFRHLDTLEKDDWRALVFVRN